MPAPALARALPAAALALACCGVASCSAADGDESRAARAAPAARGPCASFPTAAASREATLAYLVGLQPTPLRFLNAAGTDSALPDPAFAALQGKGPSYLYPPASAEVRARFRERLETVGPWATMLVAWKGAERLGDSTAVIRLHGHYVIGEGEGTSAPARAVRFVCGAEGWKMADVREERVT